MELDLKNYSLITRLLKKIEVFNIKFKPAPVFRFKLLNKKLHKFKCPKIRFKRVKRKKRIINPEVKKQKLTYIRKLLSYFFARNFWFTIHAYYATKRLAVQSQVANVKFKVNSNFNTKDICNTLK